MSEVAQVALITGGVGLLSLLITLWLNARTRKNDLEQRAVERREEHEEWYKQTLSEKRLQAAQQAYAWWRRLNEAVSTASGNNDPRGAENEAVRESAKQAREWYDNNSLCLERPGTSDFVGLTNSALAWADGRDIDLQKSLNEVYDCVRNLANRLLESERGGQEEGSP